MDDNFIVITGDDNLRLIGPFANIEDLRKWGRKWQEASGDDPRWQSLLLPDPMSSTDYVIRIENPADSAGITVPGVRKVEAQ